MSKILANEIANYGDDAPIELKEGLNIPVGKPLQAAGAPGSNGQVLTSTGSTVQWTTPFDGDYNSLANKPTIPAAQVSSDWTATTGVARILNKPIVPPLPSVTTATASGGGSLSYTSFNGEFTFTPPDLSNYDTAYGWGDHAQAGYLTSYTETDPVFSASDAAAVTAAKISNWDTAFGWGNHASAGYLTSYTETQTLDNVLSLGATTTRDITTTGKVYFSNNFADLTALNAVNAGTYHGMFAHVHSEGHGYFAHAGGWIQMLDTGSSLTDLADVNLATAPQTGQVLKYDGSNWVAAADGTGGGGIALTDLSATTTAPGNPALTYNNVSGVFTYTPPNLTGFLTSYTETDPVFSASAASGISAGQITNWTSAYNWGNHALVGYLTSETSHADVVVDGDFTTNGLLKRTGAGTYTSVTDNSSNWDTAFGWGDHASEGYLTSFTETDPVFTASIAAGITGAEVANWNTAYGWGDHGTQGYLTSVALNNVSDVTITTPSSGEVLTYNGSSWVNSASTGGGANVTISDTAPGSASAGDLWWESDKGRLKIYYNDTDSTQWVDASPPLAQPNVPVAAGFITLNGTSPTWTGTTGYTVSGTQPGGAGTDYVITLTFPAVYSARTDYIVQATYDGTNYIGANGAQIAVARGTGSVVFTPRRWDENPLSLGEIMVTITNL